MDPMVGCGSRSSHSSLSNEEENSNSNVISLLEVCFLCNRRFLYESSEKNPLTHPHNEEDILLNLFFEDAGIILEKSSLLLQSSCTFCKTLCNSLLEAKTKISGIIEEITALIRRSKKLSSSSSHMLSKARVISRLFQDNLVSSSSPPPSYHLGPIQIQLFTGFDTNSSSSIPGTPSISHEASPPTFSFLSPLKSPRKRQESPSKTVTAPNSSERLFVIDQDDLEDGKSINKEEKHPLEESKLEEQSVKENEKCSKSKGKFTCTICTKGFKCNRDLQSHVGYHTQNKPYTCDICGTSYRHKKALDVHVGIHRGEAKFECDHCKKVFTQKISLLRHLPMHTGETSHLCNLCGKQFLHHSSFAHHKLTHTGKKDFKCEICELQFFTSSHLKRHHRTHTGERPFKCETCERSFNEKSNLKVHQRVHTKIPAYQCTECSLGFDRKNKLTRHLATHSQPNFEND